MRRTVGQALLGLVAALAMLGTAQTAAAQIHLNPAYGDGALLGPTMARGAVVWSHGRSVEVEDSNAPTPLYMKTMKDAGWDVFRLDRMRVSDTLPNSSRALAGYADQLKDRGYRKVVLTGQSFGAFLSLMAAGQSDRVDAVVGTAPAAFGNFSDSYDSFRDNAAQLWPILRGIHNARVMLFFFHGDDFDPGGRGESARSILSSRGLDHIVVDQPALLTGHGAATTGMFVRRFGSCILRFAEAAPRRGDPSCDESWGRTPSAELMRAAAPEPRTGSGTSSPAGTGARSFLGVWYGAYINGREIALAVDRVEGDAVYADYVLGPGMEADQPMERAQRKGRIENDELVFDEKGRNVLRYSVRTDGRLSATWLDRSGKGRLETTLRRMD
ncbi:alpha/beta hydrolase [Azospirillum sp. Marseille-Q6669]